MKLTLALNFAMTVALAPVLGILAGCSRKSETSTVRVAVPSNEYFSKSLGALAVTAKATRIMINVTGPGLQNPIVNIWDMKSNAGQIAQPEPPSFIGVEVPRGADRLIQVLAVVQQVDSNAGGDGGGDSPMTFYYGDTIRSLASPNEEMTIVLQNQGTSGNSQGSISGRFFDTGGATPTDIVDMLYSPGSSRPAMIVDSGFMFAGWFQFFALKGVPFTYRLRNLNRPVFENVTPDSFVTTTRIARATVPAAFRNTYTNGTASSRVATPENLAVFGLFGPGAPAAGRACYDSNYADLLELYTSSDINSLAKLQYDPSSGLANEVQVAGGYPTSGDDQCPNGSGSFGVQHIASRKQLLSRHDSPIGNSGPFRSLAVGTSYSSITTTAAGASLALNWEYLPGVIGNGVDGVGVFTKVYATSSAVIDRWHDQAPCNQLPSFGYTEHSRIAAGSAAVPTQTYTLAGINATAWTEGRLHVVVCPYSASKPGYYDFAITAKNYSGGGGGGPAATQIVAKHIGAVGSTSAGSPQTLAAGICTPIKLVTVDSTGTPAYRSGGSTELTAAVVSAPSDVKLYSDSGCNSPSGGASTLVSSLGGKETLVFVKATTAASSFSINITDSSSGGSPLAMTTYYGAVITSTGPIDLRAYAQPAAVAHQCFPVVFMVGRDVSGQFVADATGSMVMGSFGAVTDLQFYNDGNCDTTSSSLYVNPYAGALLVYAKYTGTAASISLTGTGTSLIHIPTAVTISQPGVASQIGLMTMGTFGAESCQPARLVSVDSVGQLSPVAAATSLSLSYNGSPTPPASSGIYLDYDCATPQALPGISASQTRSSPFYFRWQTPGPLTVTGTVTAGPGGISFLPFTTTVGATVLGRIVVVPTGVSYSHSILGTFTGYGPFTLENEPFGLQLQARTPLGALLTGFNNTDLTASGINLRSDYEAEVQMNCSPITWAAGLANTTCTLADIGANNYMSKLFPFRTGGGASPYPNYQSGTGSDGHIRISKPANSVDMMTFFATQSANRFNGNCHPFLVARGYTNSPGFQATAAQSSTPVALSYASGMTGWYTDPACTVNAGGSISIPINEAGVIAYAGFDGGTPVSLTAGGTPPYDYVNAAVPTFGAGGAGAHSQYKLTMSRNMALGSCSPIMIVRTDSNGNAIAAAGTETVTLSFSGLGPTFHSAGSCSGGSDIGTSVTFAAGETAKLIYVKPTAAGTGGSVTATYLGNTGSGSSITVAP